MKTETRRWLIAFALAAVILSIPQVKAYATESPIKSHGTVKYVSSDGTQSVELYASDIQYLQNEIDKLKAELY